MKPNREKEYVNTWRKLREEWEFRSRFGGCIETTRKDRVCSDGCGRAGAVAVGVLPGKTMCLCVSP